jgi:hypothetical protein
MLASYLRETETTGHAITSNPSEMRLWSHQQIYPRSQNPVPNPPCRAQRIKYIKSDREVEVTDTPLEMGRGTTNGSRERWTATSRKATEKQRIDNASWKENLFKKMEGVKVGKEMWGVRSRNEVERIIKERERLWSDFVNRETPRPIRLKSSYRICLRQHSSVTYRFQNR